LAAPTAWQTPSKAGLQMRYTELPQGAVCFSAQQEYAARHNCIQEVLP
jgi:hypothetical protein